MPRIKRKARLRACVGGPIHRIGRASLRPGWPGPWRALGRWHRHTRAVAALQALDERMLRDIGIDRSEIESAVHGVGRDASRSKRS